MKKFLAGIAIACLMEPATTLITHFTELARTKISIKIMENNIKIKELDTSLEEGTSTRAIGFNIPDEGDYEDD